MASSRTVPKAVLRWIRVKPVGSGVFEARLFHRPAYRLYFIREGNAVIVLLCGGDKGSQARDIERAIEMAKERE